MADIIDLDLHRNNKSLLEDQSDPCSSCRQVSFCVTTCDLATAWWEQFAKKFNVQTRGE